jgi:hypothetical protein
MLEKDFTFIMRDGVKIYGDIYRPSPQPKEVTQERIPVVMTLAPYGKEGNSEKFHDKLPERLGIRRDMYSGYEAWEGPDPAYWCVRPGRKSEKPSQHSCTAVLIVTLTNMSGVPVAMLLFRWIQEGHGIRKATCTFGANKSV